jgi:N utilization substance protein A
MTMKSDFLLAFNQICSDRGLPREVVLDALQAALVSAYRHNSDATATQNITATIDLETGQARVFVEKQVVESVSSAGQEVSLPEASLIDPNAEIGDMVMAESTPKDFGRIAAQNAKQIILQRIREAEREAQYEHYVQQEGEIVHGTVHSIKPQGVMLHLGGTEAILPRSQQVPGERYNLHQRVRAYVLEVRKTGRGPQITLSRGHKNMLRRLLELEVPEIFNGAVEIKAIAREAGSRSKVAVAARQPGVDPVGACVGMRGVRIQSIVNELGGEKIDVIEWDPNPTTFIAKALSPAKVLSVQLEEDPVDGKTANVVVPDDQLSLAIGRSGQNARLGAKLTLWRIDIQSVTEAATWALQRVNEDPNVLPALGMVAELLPTVASVLRRHERERLPYSSEELLAARQVIEAVRGHYALLRDAERARAIAEEEARRAAIELAESERRAEVEAARALIPPEAYNIPLTEIGLSTRVLGHLQRSELTVVADVMERLAEGDEGLLRLDGFGPRSLAEVKGGIEELALPQVAVEVSEEVAEEEAVGEAEAAELEIAPIELAPEEPEAVLEAEAVAAEAEAELEGTPVEVAAPEEPPIVEPVPSVPDVIAEEAAAPEAQARPQVAAEPEVSKPEEQARPEEVVGVSLEEAPRLVPEEEGEDVETEEARRRRRRLRRQLVYDEEAGIVVARRRHKRGEGGDEWDAYQ